MKVLLIDIDSKIPNLALKKIEKYHLDKGDEVIWNLEIFKFNVDRIYVSCVFDWNKNKCKEWEYFVEKGIAIIGGSGYDLTTELPPEIESVKPRINLGFTTRGCIRNCSFCVVPKKEGKLKIVGDLLDLWDGKSKEVVLLDNNILALPEHFKLICKQARDNRIIIDFNQGLDHRLLNQDIVNELKTIKHKEYKFSFDDPRYISSVDRAITLLQKNKINRCTWYVLVGFNTTFEEDLFRLIYLRKRNQNAYVQRYNYKNGDKKYIALSRWANQHHIFRAMTFEQFINRNENLNYKSYVKDFLDVAFLYEKTL